MPAHLSPRIGLLAVISSTLIVLKESAYSHSVAYYDFSKYGVFQAISLQSRLIQTVFKFQPVFENRVKSASKMIILLDGPSEN